LKWVTLDINISHAGSPLTLSRSNSKVKVVG